MSDTKLQSDRPEVLQHLSVSIWWRRDKTGELQLDGNESGACWPQNCHRTQAFRAADALTSVPSHWNNEPLIRWSSCPTVDG